MIEKSLNCSIFQVEPNGLRMGSGFLASICPPLPVLSFLPRPPLLLLQRGGGPSPYRRIRPSEEVEFLLG